MALKPKKEFIQELIERRKKIGLSQEMLAHTIRQKHNSNISVITISRIERGTLNSKYETLYWMDNIICEYEEIFKNKIEPKIIKKTATTNSGVKDILNKLRPDRP
jgi:predicted transcriptional regulator